MRKNFADYAKERTDLDLAHALVSLGVDTKAWVDNIIHIAENYDITIGELHEGIWEGLRGIEVQEGFWGGVRGVAGAGMQQAGNWVGKQLDKAKNFGAGLAQTGRNINQTWQTGSAKQDVNTAINNIGKLRQFLGKVQNPEEADKFVNQTTQYLQNVLQQVANGPPSYSI